MLLFKRIENKILKSFILFSNAELFCLRAKIIRKVMFLDMEKNNLYVDSSKVNAAKKLKNVVIKV